MLEGRDIYPIGRYGRWRSRGMADASGDGFVAGSSLCRSQPVIPLKAARAELGQ